MAAFLQVGCHATPHYSKTDETDFHICLEVRILCSEFGGGLNLPKIRLGEVNRSARNDLVYLPRLARADDRARHGGMTQRPSHRDGTWRAIVTVGDRAQSVHQSEVG